jgi:hypothetical protein
MGNNLEQAMFNYFHGKTAPEEKSTVLQAANTENIYESEKAARVHTLETVSHREYNVQTFRHVADDNIDDVEQLADILKKLCNAAWGADWGELSPDLKKGENSDDIVLPQITIDINTRDIAENIGGIKPKLVDIVNEVDANNNETGDAFLIYRQWFDCNMEFNFYGRTNKEARQLQKKFENLLTVYTGYLKRQGISEMFFEREVSPKSSLNYDESTPMRCIYYYIRFESIMPIRQSLINSINAEIGANQLSTDKVKTLINNSSNNSDPIELDFFDGDNGITYNF